MLNSLSRLIAIMLFIIVGVDKLSAQAISKNQFFTAELKNIRRTQAGKIYVTVTFVSNLPVGSAMLLFTPAKDYGNDAAQCKQAVRLIDGDGNEYGANRCLPMRVDTPATYNDTGGLNVSESETSYVYEFSSGTTNQQTNLSNVNVIIPISIISHIFVGYDRYSPNQKQYNRVTSVVAVSFYNISVR